ncbi:hypothetical protein EG351_10405 [Chryseobacterium bernardetii]|nr:hypothetical protein EG351_10405 [Chryseobacterium bernardetii]
MGFYIKLDNLISSFVLLVFYTYIRIKFVDDLLPLKYLSYFKYTDIFYVIICSLLTVGILFYIKQNKKRKKLEMMKIEKFTFTVMLPKNTLLMI